jgi:hypothetical protein
VPACRSPAPRRRPVLDPRKVAGPSTPTRNATHPFASVATASSKQQKPPAPVATAAARPDPLTSTDATDPALPTAASQDLPGPVGATAETFYRLQDNFDVVMLHTVVPQHEEKPDPWKGEPYTMQLGPVRGVSMSWIHDPHTGVMPVPVIIQRGNGKTNSGWTTKWCATMIQFLQDPDGNYLRTITPDDFPTLFHAVIASRVRIYDCVNRWCAADVDFRGATLKAEGGASNARRALQISCVGLGFQLHMCRLALGPPGRKWGKYSYRATYDMCNTIDVFGCYRVDSMEEPWEPFQSPRSARNTFLQRMAVVPGILSREGESLSPSWRAPAVSTPPRIRPANVSANLPTKAAASLASNTVLELSAPIGASGPVRGPRTQSPTRSHHGDASDKVAGADAWPTTSRRQ